MRTSTEIESAVQLVGEEKTLELLSKAGFDGWDFSMFRMKKSANPFAGLFQKKYALVTNDYLKFARHLKAVGESYGICCNQSHAPFPSFSPHVRLYLERAIECTAEAGGKICIIHPDNNASIEENTAFYCSLLPPAKEYEVKIAAENMWNWNVAKNEAKTAACSNHENFLAQLEAVQDPYLVACVDIGHTEMRGLGTSGAKMIRTLGHHVQALHIHDNDRHHDSHQIPFSMQIDFLEILKALKDVDYDGWFTLEADQYLKTYNKTTAEQGVKALYASVKRLSDMYEAL